MPAARLGRVIPRAFQMHFVPDAISLQPDVETAAVLFALLANRKQPARG